MIAGKLKEAEHRWNQAAFERKMEQSVGSKGLIEGMYGTVSE
jgi:hypothetical protein